MTVILSPLVTASRRAGSSMVILAGPENALSQTIELSAAEWQQVSGGLG